MDESKFPVKRYPFRYTPVMLVLLVAGLLLCVAGFAFTTWQFVVFVRGGDMTNVYEWLKYVLLYFVSGFLGVLIVSMLIRSQYVINDTRLVLQFGFIRSSYELKTICAVRHFRGSEKLTVYFDEYGTKYAVIVVNKTWYEDFVKTLLERNEKIAFDFTSAEEEEHWKNDKKK